jgi:23S rRNA pseudouridine1911/1915/1917 synthase
MLEPEVIYEDRNFIVINKPAGLQVHAARVAGTRAEGGGVSTLVGWLVKQYPEIKSVGDDPELRPGIVHRLDKETSGVMLVARTQDYFEYLKKLFQEHEVRKTYLALVAGVPQKKQGIIDAPIGIRNGTIKRSTRSAKMAKSAVTEYKVLKTFAQEGADGTNGRTPEFSLLEVSPKTGRTHQIRVHLASIGHPVLGDRMYGPKNRSAWAGHLALHALSIEFTAADGKRMKFEAEPPEWLSTPHFS